MAYKTVAIKTTDQVGVNLQMPEWAGYLRANELNGTDSAYVTVPLIYKALRLCCDTLAGLPYHMETDDGEEAGDWPFPTDLYNLLWYTEAGRLLFGHGEWLKKGRESETQTTIRKKITDVFWLHTRFCVPFYDPSGDTLIFSYSHPGPWAGRYDLNQLVYFREFNPIHMFLPGPGAAAVALGNAKLDHYLTRFASLFFEHGAMPVVMVSPDSTVPIGKDESERVENFFKRAVSGIANAWRVLATRVKFNAEILTPSFKDMVIPDLYNQAREAVAKAFSIPQTMLDESSNKASGMEDRRAFYEDRVIPRAKDYASIINTQLFAGSGIRLVFDFNKLIVFQIAEADRARSLYYATQAGLPLDIATERLGYELSEDQMARIAGAPSLPKPLPTQDTGASTANPENVGGQPDGKDTTPAKTNQRAETQAELKRWQRAALHRFQEGKSAGFEYVPRAGKIPLPLYDRIKAGLAAAKSASDIRAAFDDVEEPIPVGSFSSLALELRRANDLLERSMDA